MGDNIFNACQIWLHSVDFDALFHSLDWLQSLDVDYIIPGHGPVKGQGVHCGEQAVPVRLAGCRGRGHRKGWSKEGAWSVSASRTAASWTSASRVHGVRQTNNVRKCYDYLMRRPNCER